MKIRTFGPHLIQLTKWGVFNCYLVREEEGLTLVDTALSGSGEAILAAAAELGQPITRITLTHAHGDHVGALDEVARQLPEAEIAFTARTAQFLRGDVTLEPDEPQAKIRGGFDTRQTTPTRLLNPDDMLGSLRVISASGHSPDHVAFLDTRDGTLIAGDAFQTQAGIAVAGRLRLLFPFPAMATWHKLTALSTARRLLDLQPTRLAVGHGRVLEQPTAAMQQAIDDAARRFGAAHGQETTA